MSGSNVFPSGAYGLNYNHDYPAILAACQAANQTPPPSPDEIVDEYRSLAIGELPQDWFDIRQSPPKFSPRHREVLAEVLVDEHGKVLFDDIGEVPSLLADDPEEYADLIITALYREEIADAYEDAFPGLSVPSMMDLIVTEDDEHIPDGLGDHVFIGVGIHNGVKKVIDLGQTISAKFREMADVHTWVYYGF